MTICGLGICALLITLIVGASGESFCSTWDLKLMEIGSRWKNQHGCTCFCLSVNNYTFSQCDVCSSVKTEEKLNESSICVSNGFKYNLNEKWMSRDIECATCKCLKFATVSCYSEKHCSNSCQEGQIPQFGSCCDVKNCTGKASRIQETRNCSQNGKLIHHGSSIAVRYHCIDKFCTCNNGAVYCFDYCEIPTNNSHYYWDKLCCPRKFGNKQCQSPLHGILNPGESLTLINDIMFCRCLDEEIYCTKKINTTSNTVQKSWKFTITYSTPNTETKGPIKKYKERNPSLTDHTLKELIIILSIFFSVIIILILVVFIIKIRIGHIYRYQGMRKRPLINHEDF